jgi:NAD(P)-dependent dehydrogenase (short-subunit alcohol dehydrogenase family)
MEFTGKWALVTGGAKRIGKQIALSLAERGCDLMIHYGKSQEAAKDVAQRIQQNGRKAFLFRAELRNEKEIKAMFDRIRSEAGRLDYLINNAGVFFHTPLPDLNAGTWDMHMDTNLKAPFLCSLEGARLMEASESAHIINIASVGGLIAWGEYLPYCVSKAGMLMMTKALAKLLAPKIRVNAIAPGPVLPPDNADSSGFARETQKTLLKQAGDPLDIANAVIFLLNSSYINGQTIVVDGGRSV